MVAYKGVGRFASALSQQWNRLLCGLQGHLIVLHFEPNRLSLHCAVCGYHSQGWEVGRPLSARRMADNTAHVHQIARDRRRGLRAVPSTQHRMAS